MPFFDFHCHPGLKPQFSDPAAKPSPWDFIQARLAIFAGSIGINKLFNQVLNSQSSLSQLVQADVKLIGLILHAPEERIGKALSEKRIVNKGSVNLINKKQLQYLASGIHSYELINEELRSLTDSIAPSGLGGASFRLLSKASDFNEAASQTVFGVIIIEGLHCFFNDPLAPDAKAIFTQNFEAFTNTHTVLAINICHMQQNPFCNHAHGIQFFTPSYFYPTRAGITTWGREVISSMMDKKILTDIKHMSLRSRWQLYDLLRDPNDDTKFIQPIICTHAGVTGLSVRDRGKYLLKKPVDKGLVYELAYLKPKSTHDPETYYNCSSINLYDEDISTILLSGGIIGLSFDQRILGFADENVLPQVTTPHDVEYISHMESDFFLGPDPVNLPVWLDDNVVWRSEDFEFLDPSLYIEMHRRSLVNTIIHVLWVANNHPAIPMEAAVKQICIGSDFDGLINAIDCCMETTRLSQLKAAMRPGLTQLLSSEGLQGISVDELLENIFYRNGRDFVLKRLRTMKGS